ncbi:MAG: hypothetical protein IPK72_21630 [Candidatus Eisenbacteria bacterium]|nr:hypothetical protein [Candidatus Eisenbacteria bacterium]
MSRWQRCEFEPVDVIVNADGRPLDSSYGFEGPLTPAPFSGAVRTAILRDKGLTDPLASDPGGVRQVLGVPHKGPPAASAAYRFAGAWPQSRAGEPLLPAPAFVLRDPFGTLLPRPVQAEGLRAWDHADGLPSLLGTPGVKRGHVEDRLLPLSLLSVVLGGDQTVSGRAFRNLVLSPVRAERRFGHRRAPTGAPETHMLFSRGVLRSAEAMQCGKPFLASWVGFIRGVDSLLPADGSLLRVGGDGRRAAFRQTPADLGPVARLGADVSKAVAGGHREVLVYLATPAVFSAGWRPGELPGLELVSAAVGPPFPLSGWDYHHNRPKPQRLAVHAGSTYFYRVTDTAAAALTLTQLHFNDSICDDLSDGLSGFGMCLAGLLSVPTREDGERQ